MQDYCMPHHAVIRADKLTTKLRIVYDTLAKTKGPSLNDWLYAGPTFEQSIFDIVLRFRSYPRIISSRYREGIFDGICSQGRSGRVAIFVD